MDDASALEPLDETDLRILGGLRRVHEITDPVPAGLTERVAFAVTVAALEAEVAELTAHRGQAVGVRGGSERGVTVTFSGSDLTAMITVEEVAGARRISGWSSATPVVVELRAPTTDGVGATTTTTDAEGRFGFEGVRPGLVHLVLRREDDPRPPLITPLFEI